MKELYKYLYIQGRKYYLNGTFNNWTLAKKFAKMYKKKYKTKHFIRNEKDLCGLYLNKIIKFNKRK